MSKIHGITWLLIREGRVLLERCPKKAQVLGVGEWFVPGGKIEPDESPEQTLIRELSEEWPGVTLLGCEPLPIVEGSRVPAGNGLFLIRPFVISVAGEIPSVSADGIELRWAPLHEALASPVPQVRMMVAAAGAIQEISRLQREIKAMNKMFGEVCEPLHECCQRYKLGLGGEKVQELVVAEVDRLRSDADRLDWLDEGNNFYLVTPATNMIGVRKGWTHRVGRSLESIGERCFDVREAIDKAREAV